MVEYKLHERHEWLGRFWPAGEPNVALPGILTFDPDEGISLRLIDRWPSPREQQTGIGLSEDPNRWAVVHGHTGPTKLTLLEASLAQNKVGGGVSPEATVRSRFLLVGCHLENADDRAFTSVAMMVENMTSWTARSAMTVHSTRDGSGVEADDLDALEGAYPGGLVRLRHRVANIGRLKERQATSALLQEWVSAEFIFNELSTLDDLRSHLSMLTDLISLAAGAPSTAISISARLPIDSSPSTHRVSVLYRPLVKAQPEASLPNNGRFLFTLTDVDFATLWPKWAAVYERFHQTVAMVLGLRAITEGFIETRVITAVSAAESMHQALGLEPQMPASTYKTLLKTVKGALDTSELKAQKQWLSDRLSHNERSLKSRFLDLASRTDGLVEALVPDGEAWARGAVNARNHLAHTGRADGAGTGQLLAAVEVTAAVIVLNLVYELGINETVNVEELLAHPMMNTAAYLAAKHFPRHG